MRRRISAALLAVLAALSVHAAAAPTARTLTVCVPMRVERSTRPQHIDFAVGKFGGAYAPPTPSGRSTASCITPSAAAAS